MSDRLELTLPKMDGHEVQPGVYLIGEPTPIPGTTKMRCLADFGGVLALVELSVRFAERAGEAKHG